MHHYIDDSARNLILWQRQRKFRIHYCKRAYKLVAGVSPLVAQKIVGKHGAVARLASCGGYSENTTNFECMRFFYFITPYIPKIAVIDSTDSDCLCGIYHAAAAYCKHAVGIELFCLLNSLQYVRITGICLYSFEQTILN